LKNKILHVLSWIPTAECPTAGNFCLRHIEAAGLFSHAVLLTVHRDLTAKKRKIEVAENENYTDVKIIIPCFSTGFSFLDKPLNKYRLFKAYNFGFQYIKKNIFMPDLLHLHVVLPLGKMALYWKKKYKLPYILTEHWSIYLPEDMRLGKNKISKKLLQICNNAAAVTTVSAYLQQNMQNCGVKNHFHILPNVVDTQIFRPQEKQSFDKKQILHVSTLTDSEKNFSGILRVIKKIRTQRNDFVLNVVHDEQVPEFEQYVKENNLSDTVIFHGRKTEKELSVFYNNADFVLLFSHFETFSCVVMEALSCGTPALATCTGAIPEMLSEDRGVIVPPRDETALEEALLYLLDNFSRYDAQKLRDYALAHFDLKAVGRQIERIYENLLH